MKTIVSLAIEHNKHIPDLAKLVEQRSYTIDGVSDANVMDAERELELASRVRELTKQNEAQKDEWLSWNEKRAALEANARRYEWLRDKSEPGICAFYLSVGKAFDGVKFKRETVDEAIDAQIEAGHHTASKEQP